MTAQDPTAEVIQKLRDAFGRKHLVGFDGGAMDQSDDEEATMDGC